MRIKYQLLIITIILILFPMLISTAVVSIIVQRQNDSEAWSRIDNALQLVVDDIDLLSHRLTKGAGVFLRKKAVLDSLRFITANEKEYSNLPLLHDVANRLAGEMRMFASSAEFERIFFYYPDERLLGLHQIFDGDHQFFFYFHDKEGLPIRISKECHPNQDCQPLPWKEEQIKDWPQAQNINFNGPPRLLDSGNFFGVEIAKAAHNSNPENGPSPPFTKIAIHKNFDLTFAQHFSDLTGTDIAFFTANRSRMSTRWNSLELPAEFINRLLPGVNHHEKLLLETPYYVGFRPFMDDIGKLVGVVTARFSVDGTIAKTREARTYLIGIAIFSILLMIPVALFLSHRFVKPINGLIKGAQAFGRGELAYRIPEKKSDEIGELATAFNSMAGSMQRSQGELEHLNQRLEEYNRDLEQKINEATIALIEKNNEMKQDLKIAAEFQTAILSKIPSTTFLLCGMKYIPYRGGVSGDVYDISIDRNGAANIFLGDATGHGVAAAIMTMMAQIGLDSLSGDFTTDEIIRQLNSLFAIRERDMSITGVFMRIKPSGELSITNAGHPPAIIVPMGSNKPIHFKEGGAPLGMFKEELAPFVEMNYHLKSGDKVFLYTDGITEWQNQEDEEFGIDRLSDFFMQNKDMQIDATLNNLLTHLTQFAKGRECKDDLTLLGFQYQPM